MPAVGLQVTNVDTEKREQKHDENERRLKKMRHDVIESTFRIAASRQQGLEEVVQQHTREHRHGQLPDAEEGNQSFHHIVDNKLIEIWRQGRH